MIIRTGYSFRSAVGQIYDVMDRIKEIGWSFAPITDTASTFGYSRWTKLAKKAGLKPIYGVEIQVTDSPNAKKISSDGWVFLAKEKISFINRLVEVGSSQFRYTSLLTYDQANKAEGVFRVVGTKANLDLVAADQDTFVSLSPSMSRGQFKKALSLGLSFVASSDNRFTREGDTGLYEVICGRSSSTQSYPQYILSDEEWEQAMLWVPEPNRKEALANRERISQGCNASLVLGTLLSPAKPQTLEQMCREGAKRIGCDLSRPEYEERLMRELKLIDEKKFEDYFYIISDMCQWARQRMIVGPARGSSCGSLVCYLLEITTVDPIPYGLIFERFIDINRDDLPDIDIDFSDNKRHLVFEYAAAKYGSAHVARLGTVALYKPRSAINEAAAALDIPTWKTRPVLDSIIERSGGDSRALQAIEDTFNDTDAGRKLLLEEPELKIAGRMEGHPRHHSQHAAGIIITELPVSEYVAIDSRTGATHCDKKDAEDLNLLKIDALGLTQLSIFEEALKLAGLPMHYLEKIDLNDSKAFDVLTKGQFAGIFQFNGLALQSVTSQVGVNNLEDIISITALARPGPLNTGGTNHWVKVKTGKEPLTYPHPLFEPHLKNTLGVVAYQEQVMNIGRDIGDLSWGDVTALRKAMSKSLGKEYFDQFGDKWKANAIKKGIDPSVAEKVWDDLCAYGSWAFNRSHAVAYGLVSYYCCWLKAYYPMEFIAAALTHTDTIDNQIKLLRELHNEGIGYIPAHKEYSTDRWTVGFVDGKKVLVGPATIVKGIGPKMMQAIMSARARGEPLPQKAEKLLDDPKTEIDDLFPIEAAFKRLLPNPAEKNIFTPPVLVKDCQVDGTEREVLVFVRIAEIKPKDENEQINVAKRGYKFNGPSQALNLRIEDDTDAMFAKVDRFKFEDYGKPIIERGRAGSALYAIKGTIPRSFRMISIKQIRYIGDMKEEKSKSD